MKKLFFGLIFIILFVSLFAVDFVAIATKTDNIFAKADSIQDEIDKEINKSVDELISNELEEFFNSLDGEEKSKIGSSIKNIINKIIDGENITPTDFLSIIWSAVSSNVTSILASLITIVALSILYNLAKNLNSGFIKESTSQIIYYIVYGAIIAILLVMVNSVIMSAKQVIEGISTLVEVSFPILLTLLTALGATASAAAYQPLILIVSKVIIGVINAVIMPMFIATVVFTIIGNLTNNIKLTKLTKAIGSIAQWTLGIMFGVVISLITAQGMVGASIDTVSVRSVKFALQSYVPILGGYISEGFDIIMASALVIKNALGLTAILILLIIVLRPILRIIVLNLMLKITAGVIEPLSDSRISNLLYSTAKNLNILISVTLGLTFLCFVMFMLVISTFSMGVL